MARLLLVFFVVAVCLASVHADVYLHSMRGSNNRLKGENRDRTNANRLFDSQNNNRGGYNAGSLFFYQGSQVYFEWTAQHSCQNANSNCEFIVQYMCDDRLRDGTIETTIPLTVPDAIQCDDFDCDTDPTFGRQESFDSYFKGCLMRSRNKGLFTSNQNLNNKKDARYTRQNPDGTRFGYECPEERDYYPYWHPTQWRDIAILTNSPTRCPAYVTESANVKSRWYCNMPDAIILDRISKNTHRGFIPIEQKACEAISFYDTAKNVTVSGVWTESPAFNIPPPVCRENVYSRDNHLGNTIGGFPMSFNWTVPDNFVHERCAMRLRYNISTTDYPAFSSPSALDSGTVNVNMSRMSTGIVGAISTPDRVPIYANFKGMTEAENAVNPTTGAQVVNTRGYNLRDYPDVDIFGSLLTMAAGKPKLKFTLAVDTSQFGRTFQDRSHRFAVRARPADIPRTARILNLNVRGKRGNIVQVYPAVEYDFVPNRLQIGTGDYIHIQWTGSNANPQNNDGQGRQGSDRSNIVTQRPASFVETERLTYPRTESPFGTNYPKKLLQKEIVANTFLVDPKTKKIIDQKIVATQVATATTKFNFLGWDHATLSTLATLNTVAFGGDMDELDDAGTYFTLPLKQVFQEGIFHYMCTRNNNFSNRSQKGKLVVTSSRLSYNNIGWNGGQLNTGTDWLIADQGAFLTMANVGLESMAKLPNAKSVTGKASNFLRVEPAQLPGAVSVGLKYVPNAMSFGAPVIMRAANENEEFQPISAAVTVQGDTAVFPTNQGGVYVVTAPDDTVVFVLILIALIVLAGVLVYAAVYCKRKGEQERLEYNAVSQNEMQARV